MLPLLAACAGNGEGLDANGRPISSEPQPLLPELQSIQDQVFTPICTTCHAGAAAPLGFRLDANSSYAMLVGQPSVEVPFAPACRAGSTRFQLHHSETRRARGCRRTNAARRTIPSSVHHRCDSPVDPRRRSQPTAAALGASTAPQIRALAPLPGERLTQPPRELLRCRGRRARRIAARGGCRHADSERRRRKLPTTAMNTAITQLRITVWSLAPTVLAIEIPGRQLVGRSLSAADCGPRRRCPLTSRAGKVIDDFVLEVRRGARAMRFVGLQDLLLPTLLALGAFAPQQALAEPYFAVREGLKCGICSRQSNRRRHAHLPSARSGGRPCSASASNRYRRRDAVDRRDQSISGDRREPASRCKRYAHSQREDAIGLRNRGAACLSRRARDSGPTLLYVDQRLAPGASTNAEAYGRLWFGGQRYYIKAGQMFLPYGLRLQDDSAFVRQVPGINFATPDHGSRVRIRRYRVGC